MLDFGIPQQTATRTRGIGYTRVNYSKLNSAICYFHLIFIISFNHFRGLVLIFRIKPTPLVFRFIVHSQALKPNSFHLNNTTPIRLQAPLHVVHQNRALAAQFLIYTLKSNPLTNCLIARS
jgi:hypothetical protein